MSYLATYGTLMREHAMHEQLGLTGRLRFEVDCQIPGVLYDLGRFPGALSPETAPEEALETVGDEPVVHGEMFRLADPEVLAVLDRYEGYDPDRESASLFVRREVTLQAPEGRTAWVYWYNGPPADGTLVPSGHWRPD